MNAGYARVSRKDQRLERRGAGREPGCRPRGGDGGPATVGLLSLIGLYALAVGVALIVLALRLRGLRRGRGLQGDLNPRGGNE